MLMFLLEILAWEEFTSRNRSEHIPDLGGIINADEDSSGSSLTNNTENICALCMNDT